MPFKYNPITGMLDEVDDGSGGGTVVGPGTSIVGDIAIWDDTTGTTLADSGVAFPIPANKGGTSLATYALGDIIYGSGVNTLTKLSASTDGKVLTLAAGIPSWVTPAGGTVTSVSGTLNRITSTGGTTPVIDIDAAYVGQTSLTTLGTVTTGTWSATAVDATHGGTAQTTYATGDILYASAANTLSKLAAAADGRVLTLAAGVPSWAVPAAGTVTSVSVVTANGFAGTVATATTTPAITLTTSQTGLLSGNGTAITGTAITQYNVITGGASNAPNSVAPSATSGVPLISQGAASQPVFGTAVVAGGGTGLTSATAYAVLTGGTTSTGAFQSIASVGTSGQVLTSNGAGALPTFQTSAASSAFTVLSGQIFTSSGAFTYTPTANMKYVIVELVGGGGGSGGVAGGATNSAAAGGGGGGAYAKFILTAAQVGASLSGSVGAGGTAGSSGANAGGTGGSTTLATSSSWTAAGGVGGNGATANNTAVTATGGAGGTVTTGTGTVLNNQPGGAGSTGYALGSGGDNVYKANSGRGGNSGLGQGAPAIMNFNASNNTVGTAGTVYGGGASGSISTNTASNSAGAAGAVGVAIFTEYC